MKYTDTNPSFYLGKPGSFDRWMHEVDILLLNALGVTTSDIADRCYRDMYNDEVSPAEMVAEIVSEGLDAL